MSFGIFDPQGKFLCPDLTSELMFMEILNLQLTCIVDTIFSEVGDIFCSVGKLLNEQYSHTDRIWIFERKIWERKRRYNFKTFNRFIKPENYISHILLFQAEYFCVCKHAWIGSLNFILLVFKWHWCHRKPW